MTNFKILIYIIIYFLCIQKINSQTINWNSIKDTKHIINGNLGWDHSTSFGLGYGYKLNTKLPIVLNASFSMPFGETILDDFKTKIGAQIVLLNQSNFKASVGINGIYRRYETRLVRLQNFGSETKGTFGYYKSKWFVAAEVGFDKAIVTHFKHSDEFKDDIYPDVIDGWYEPATGGNFYYGLQTGFSFKQHDCYLNIGRVITQDFKTTPVVPFYFQLGYNYKLNAKNK